MQKIEAVIFDFWGVIAHRVDGVTAIDTSVMQIVESLKTQGIKVGLLSNAGTATYAANADTIKKFDAVVFSTHVGLLKPDAKIYHAILERLGVEPPASIFIDDDPANIAGGKQVGMHAILFENPQKLREDLARYSLTVH